jgi:hypothetical protein
LPFVNIPRAPPRKDEQMTNTTYKSIPFAYHSSTANCRKIEIFQEVCRVRNMLACQKI